MSLCIGMASQQYVCECIHVCVPSPPGNRAVHKLLKVERFIVEMGGDFFFFKVSRCVVDVKWVEENAEVRGAHPLSGEN